VMFRFLLPVSSASLFSKLNILGSAVIKPKRLSEEEKEKAVGYLTKVC
jgi:hypothetical protein